jgi:hypothetical protein
MTRVGSQRHRKKNIWRVTQINEGPTLLDFHIFPGIVSILLQNIYSIQSMFFPYCEK